MTRKRMTPKLTTDGIDSYISATDLSKLKDKNKLSLLQESKVPEH